MVYGGRIVAQSLHDLGVRVIFGVSGLPVAELAQEALYLGIRFLSFRNEQAAAYAATAYGYLTGRPGVCICVGGPGIIHAMAGIPHAAANSWPLLMLAGSSETHNSGKGAFQEVDAIALLTPHAKLAARPSSPETIPKFIRDAYRATLFGKPGPAFVDLPADYILGHFEVERNNIQPFFEIPLPAAPEKRVCGVAEAIKKAKAPLLVLGKGAAFAGAEKQIRALVDQTHLYFFPTPMGKGIVPDSSPYNVSAARSAALKEADVILVLGAKLNWILAFGLPPKWRPDAKIIQVDITADELGKNGRSSSLSMVGDIGLVTDQLLAHLKGWQWNGKASSFSKVLQESKARNEAKAAKKVASSSLPMAFEKAFDVMKSTLDELCDPSLGGIVFVSEGANAMDISRSIFTLEHPRLKLDAGTYATMGVGLGYCIAAFAAYNLPQPEAFSGAPGRKKIVAIEGDSAFGFSGMEVETMARYGMDVLIFIMNNGGLYRGDAESAETWTERQKVTIAGSTETGKGLSAWSLGFQTEYQKIAEMAGGIGLIARTPEELRSATIKGYEANVPVVINVMIDPQSDLPMDFSWLDMAPPKTKMAKI